MNIPELPSVFSKFVVSALLIAVVGCGGNEEEVILLECEPKTCEELGYACGEQTDNCGNAIDCLECEAGYDCEQNQCVALDLVERLESISGLTVQEITSHEPGTEAYLLHLEQPEDHGAPEGNSFRQRMVLIHRDVNAPLVLHTLGYGLGLYGSNPSTATERLTEPTQLLEANELLVEHRYFGVSVADEPDWSHLNIWQSANDSHQIRQAFASIYQQPWIGTGVSKGGMTAVFHHRFFPDDLDGIVPYVTPITFGFDDERYQIHMDSIGPADGLCRERVEGMAREFIERRDEAADYVAQRASEADSVDRETLESLVASRAIGYPMSFWQYWGSNYACAYLPHWGTAMEDFAPWFISEPAALFYQYGFEPTVGPYSYQVANELGQPAYANPQLEDVLEYIDFERLQQFAPGPMPWGDNPTFDPQAMVDIDEYLRHQADRVLALYGEWDPWSGGMITLNEHGDNSLYVAPGLHHGATLSDLSNSEREEAVAQLMRWAYPDDYEYQALVAARAGQSLFTWDVEGHRQLADGIAEQEQRLLHKLWAFDIY